MSGNCVGVAVVVAVSSCVALMAAYAHRQLSLAFMKKAQNEIGMGGNRMKKKVRFAADVVEPSWNNKNYRKRHFRAPGDLAAMPDSDLPLNVATAN
ncbi:hypothetical protein AXF42_Ash010183 [Apostasia shenzhenica]|uniref:Uncharacterized protein n=1 Tax=Apostasia shenzhenica TaxID=1088818 RepID=A0A2I0A9R6_9ASPA|nr:hypothetical protein AXF42_Ash010183 [Apostasia shenzhenica]